MDAQPLFEPSKILLLLRAYMQQHVEMVLWVKPTDLAAFMDTTRPAPRIAEFFVDGGFSVRMPLAFPGGATVEFPKCLRLTCKGDVTYRLVASLAPDADPSKAMFALTDDHQVVMVLQTRGAAELADGTVQIYGGEPGLLVITPAMLRHEQSKVFQHGDTVLAFSTEARELAGEWKVVPVEVALDSGLLRPGVLPGT
jgi:hypothetical protein